MQFRVKYAIEVNGKDREGIASEADWFLIDQQGRLYSYGPMEHIRPIEAGYKFATPLVNINDEWLTIEEIEKRLTEVNK